MIYKFKILIALLGRGKDRICWSLFFEFKCVNVCMCVRLSGNDIDIENGTVKYVTTVMYLKCLFMRLQF